MLGTRALQVARRLLRGADGGHNYLVAVLFLSLLVLGVALSRDFGAHFDEYNNQELGNDWGAYVDNAFATGDVAPVEDRIADGRISHNLCHGPFWELSLYYARKALLPRGADPRDVLLLRHLANFLLYFTAVVFFYLTCVRCFRSYQLGLVGCLLLVVHPRVFADSFYNTVDLAMLSFYVISTYTLIKFLNEKSGKSAVYHAVTCAFLVDTRAAGLIMPFVTTLLFVEENLRDPGARRRAAFVSYAYLVVFSLTMVVFWPFLWCNTLGNLIESIHGGMLPSDEVTAMFSPQGFDPLYTVRWMVITTPPVYLLLFALGAYGPLARGPVGSRVRSDEERGITAALLLFAIPLVAAALAGTRLYNSWRHHYFIYPAFVMVCTHGVKSLWRWAGGVRHPLARRAAVASAVALPLLGAAGAASFMVRNHPFEFTYANVLAGTVWGPPRAMCMEDYWSVSSRQGLEYVLAHDRRDPLCVHFPRPNLSPKVVNIIPPGDRKRVVVARELDQADYVVDDYHVVRDGRLSPALGAPVHSIRVDGVTVAVVYKRESAP